MTSRHLLTAAAIAAFGGVFAASASASAAANVSLTIRHQIRGCHTWSVNSGPYRASQSITMKHGSVLTVTDNDVMPHRLIKVAGPTLAFKNLKTGMGAGMGTHASNVPGAMTHMGASTRVFFAQPGVYRFVTRAGEDYMPGMKTVGEDNVLRLQVTVT
jgi:hypothetical protein